MSHITERSMYPPILQELSKLGFTGLQEVDLGGQFPDVEFWYGNHRFILEVKIGTWQRKLVKSIIQAKKYSELAKTNNIVLLFYPPEIRRPLIPSQLNDLVLKTSIDALVLTEYWKWDYTSGKRPKLGELLSELKQRIEAKKPVVSLSLVIETLRESIVVLSDHLKVLSNIDMEKLLSSVVGRFDLFVALGETSNIQEEDLRMATIDLSSYLLLNQILFYHIYSQLTGNVPELQTENLDSLSSYFKKITDINYKQIYAVDVLSNLPRTPKAIEVINDTIEAIKTVKPQLVEHDLLGRLFHELLPPATRKVLAAFYTRPVAAEILATLAIDSSNETILDPACGSGTLLVSAYKRKMELQHPRLTVEKALSHTKFVERDIVGIDIMPFAAHLSAIHLASQNFDVTTNRVLVGVKNSLKLREGSLIEPFSKNLQKTLVEQEYASSETSGAVGLTKSGDTFRLGKVDTVIMNPPFTKEERLPKDYKDALEKFAGDLQTFSGKSAGLWGYFLALATKFGKKVACVIPINLLRGQGSLKLRLSLLNGNFTWKYIVKATENYGFTEGAEYRDILLVTEVKKSNPDDKAGIVLIKKRLEKLSFEEAKEIALKITNVRAGSDIQCDDFDIYWVTHRKLSARKEHLMPIVAFSNIKNMQLAYYFIERIEKDLSSKLRKLPKKWIVEGFRPYPKGISKVAFVTRPFHPSREEQAFMILKEEGKDFINAKIKDSSEEILINKKSTIPSLRTLTGIQTYDFTGLHDYVITGQYPKLTQIAALSLFSDKSVNWEKIKSECHNRLTHIVVSRRINWYSPNVSHLAFYSDIAFAPSDQGKLLKVKNKNAAKILSLSLNSILSLLQLFMYKEESTGRWLDIRTTDLVQTYILNFERLNETDTTELLQLFDELKSVQFPGYRQQLKERFWGRVKLDSDSATYYWVFKRRNRRDLTKNLRYAL